MKKFLSCCLLLIAVVVGSSFSPKPKEKIYSCNKELNTYIVNHLDEVSKMTLEQLYTYDAMNQRAIFATFSPEKQREIWREKLIKDSERYFDSRKEYLLWVADLQMTAPDDQLPSKKELEVIFGKEDAALIFSAIEKGPVRPDQEDKASFVSQCDTCKQVGCECSTSDDWCAVYCYQGAGCIPTGSGCGFLWRQMCNGKCTP